MKRDQALLKKIQGSLVGGAAGDALGYTIEFWDEDEIFSRFGESGIQGYVLDGRTKKALISDDTQMVLFTANGMLLYDTRISSGIATKPRFYVRDAYLDWLKTQTLSIDQVSKLFHGYTGRSDSVVSWLCDVPELYDRRAPGNTCLSALEYLKGLDPEEQHIDDFIRAHLNDSKGCGGIMRIAPVGLLLDPGSIQDLDYEAAQIAAITHGHSLGYMSSAVLAHIVHECAYDRSGKHLSDIVTEARDQVVSMFKDDKHINELKDIIDMAIDLSSNDKNDIENIHMLGEGWVAEETLAIAVYCALRYSNDFTGGIVAAVNHKGDSDSTGAVTGNILGAYLGSDAIDDKWKKDLELYDVILEIASDLYTRCQFSSWGHDADPFGSKTYADNPEWTRKYVDMRWKE